MLQKNGLYNKLKLKNKKIVMKKTLLTLALLCFINIPLCAQENFDEDTIDTTPAANIDSYWIILFIAAIGLGYVFLNQKLRIKKKYY